MAQQNRDKPLMNSQKTVYNLYNVFEVWRESISVVQVWTVWAQKQKLQVKLFFCVHPVLPADFNV